MATQESIIGLLTNLPPGVNPYTALQDLLRENILPINPESFITAMKIFGILISFVVLMNIAALVNNLRRGNWWIFRFQNSQSSMPYISANGSTSWTIPGVFYYCLLIVYCWLNVQSSRGAVKDIVKYADAIIWISTLLWIPSFFTAWAALWSLATSYGLQSMSTSSLEASSPSRLLSAPLVNSIAIGVPTLAVLSFIPLSVVSAKHYSQAMSIYASIDEQLGAGAIAVNGGTAFDITALSKLGPDFGRFATEIDAFSFWFKRFNLTLSGFSGIVFVLLTIFAILHIRLLRRIMSFTKGSGSTILPAGSNKTITTNSKVSEVQKSYITLLFIFIVFDIIVVLTGLCSLRTALDIVNIRSNYRREQLLTILYLFALPAVPMSFLILSRSLQPVVTTSIGTKASTTPRHFPLIKILPQSTAINFSNESDLELAEVKAGKFDDGSVRF